MIDLCLWEIFFAAELLAAGKTRSPRWIVREADQRIERCNAETIRRALEKLRQRGYIETIRGSVTRARITNAGRRWAAERFPTYHADRPWDGRLYLATYDVPERYAVRRQQLRRFLRHIRCAPLQASVWVTPYNPREAIRRHVREHRIPGVIVSEFGRGSVVGEGTYRDLVAQAYDLPRLDARYAEFLAEFRGRPSAFPLEVGAAFASILADDPQLPFELLPRGWRGDEAYAFASHRYARAYRVEKCTL